MDSVLEIQHIFSTCCLQSTRSFTMGLTLRTMFSILFRLTRTSS